MKASVSAEEAALAREYAPLLERQSKRRRVYRCSRCGRDTSHRAGPCGICRVTMSHEGPR